MDDAVSLNVLSAMITPAVLILASGSLILTTSQRLSRVVERVRKISTEFMQMKEDDDTASSVTTKRLILYRLLEKSVRRSRLLTRVMMLLYVSLGLFVATSLAIGVVAITHLRFTWIPTALGLIGAIFLFFSAAFLIAESRLTYLAIADEMDFVIESSRSTTETQQAPKKKRSRSWFNF
jgi:hypothetical protein